MKYYYSFELCDGWVMTLEEAKESLKEEDIGEEEIELEEMKRDIGGNMYCSAKEYFIEKGDCGKWCSMYSPCNGKSGRCRELENGFIGTGKKFILNKSGILREKLMGDK